MKTTTNDYSVTLREAVPFVSQYPPAYSVTYVKATTETYPANDTTDPANTLLGDIVNGVAWLAPDANQRFHIDLGSAKTITRIYYENAHWSGLYTDAGAKNFTFWGSNDSGAFDELTYATDTNWTQLTTSQSTFDKHIAENVVDPKYITVTNSTPYRYYAIKIADVWATVFGNMSIRRIELQTASTSIQDVLVETLASTGATYSKPITVGTDTVLDPNSTLNKFGLCSPSLVPVDAYSGITSQMISTQTIALGSVCYHDVNNYTMTPADASAAATTPVVGMALASITAANTGKFLLQGMVHLHTLAPNWTIGGLIYLSETAGAMTQTKPTTSGSITQVLGVAITKDIMYFNPQYVTVEHA